MSFYKKTPFWELLETPALEAKIEEYQKLETFKIQTSNVSQYCALQSIYITSSRSCWWLRPTPSMLWSLTWKCEFDHVHEVRR